MEPRIQWSLRQAGLVDYANPLDSPVGAHVVTELVRPIGSGIAVTRSVDLGEVSYVRCLAGAATRAHLPNREPSIYI